MFLSIIGLILPFRGMGVKNYKPVSRILSCLPKPKRRQVLGYHLSVPLITYRDQAAYPVPCLPQGRLGRAALKRYYMWHFSMQGLPANDVTIKGCELLPHIFTFTPCGVVIFCGTISPRLRRGPAIHRCIALCCPDFPTQFALNR